MKIPPHIRQFVEVLAGLPGIGPRQATRIAFYVLHKGVAMQRALLEATQTLGRVQFCPRCFFVHTNVDELCEVCGDAQRDQTTIAVVEKETDLISLENAGVFKGRYMVLGGFRKHGILGDEQKMRISILQKQIEQNLGGSATEIIIALNPTSVGDINASLLAEMLRPYAKTISRLGRGIPTGGEIEFADDETLKEALTGRK
jgi:recombination protein RecR